jgi:hypothetical protein
MKKRYHVEPKAVCKGALAVDPDEIVVVTRGPSGHIDVFASDPGSYDMLAEARRHIRRLAA